MQQPSPKLTVAGVDVGGARKGFHAVALRGGAYLDQLASCDPAAVAQWCRELGARCIGIDAPCSWNTQPGARSAERELAKQRISCFATPTRERAAAATSGFYDWMLQGEALYAALRATHPLSVNSSAPPTGPVCFETFPQAIACVLAGRIVSAREKLVVRAALLRRAGFNVHPREKIDIIDAWLCAYAAQRVIVGDFQTFGESATGYIVVPASALAAIAAPTPLPASKPVSAPVPVAPTRHASKGTTLAGYVNRNGQHNLGRTDPPLPGNDHCQVTYVMQCSHCGHRYGANGSDIFLRKCPACQSGAPGLAIQ